MYAIPVILLLIVLAGVAIAWSPLVAVFVAVALFLAFLAYAGQRPRPDRTRESVPGSAETSEDETSKGPRDEPPG